MRSNKDSKSSKKQNVIVIMTQLVPHFVTQEPSFSLKKRCQAIYKCFFTHTHLDQVEAGLSFVVQGTEDRLQSPPGNTLTTACLAHKHGGVSGIFYLIKLDDFRHGKRSHLQTTPM